MAEAHLNGSLNLRSAEDVFRTVSEIAGETIKRLPDGETGERRGWIEAIGPSATLYLGLVHHQDGVDGTQRRVDVARRHYSQFGVSTECGMGRKPRELVAKLLTIQREVRVD